MYLVDSNVWMQILRDREHAPEARQFLSSVPVDQLFVTKFSVFTVGIVLRRHGELDRYSDFIRDTVIDGGVTVIDLPLTVLETLPEQCQHLNLNFDDGYQYLAAEAHNLTIVSHDPDFDKTPRGRSTPAQVLASQQ